MAYNQVLVKPFDVELASYETTRITRVKLYKMGKKIFGLCNAPLT